MTPNFPDGLTIVAGAGQWRGASGDIVKEHSYVVTIFYSIHDSHANGEIQEIRADYQRLYQQESVLRTDSVDQVSF